MTLVSSVDLVTALVFGAGNIPLPIEGAPNPDKALQPNPPTYNPSHKPGDTIIYTSDQAAYHVHFDILAFSSRVFSSLLKPSSTNGWNEFEINETSATFSAFLQFAYARDVPPITTFAALENALTVCTKYELLIMVKLLRGLLTNSTSPVYLENDPLLAFGIALRFDFDSELSRASRLLVRSIDLRDSQTVQILRSSSTGIRILGMLALRHSTLAGLLLSKDGIVLQDTETLKRFTCPSCFHNRSRWITQWTQEVYDILARSCVTQQERLFRVGYVLEMMSNPGACSVCRVAIVSNVSVYESWMKAIRDELEAVSVKELLV